LKAWNAYQNNPFEIFFWRSRGGVEVDFILYGEQGIYAIEVKNTDKIRSDDLRSLREFRRDYPSGYSIFLYRGNDRLLRDNVLCLPCNDFLKELDPDKSLQNILT
jgi:predicted AAA+ superfamily ATPase